MLLNLVWLLAQESIQSRIDRARPGDTVVLEAGVYRERVSIAKPLTLEGRGEVVIDGENSGTVVTVTGAKVTLRGLTIRNSGDSFSLEDSAIKFEDSNGCVVEDCRLENVFFGLYVSKSSGCHFRRIFVSGKKLDMPRRGDGVRLWYSDDTTLEEIEMVDSRDFIIWFARRTVVRHCRVSRGRYGLHYMYCDDNLFENNRFTGNQVGGTIMYSRRITMKGNRFEKSRGPSAYGMLLKDADDVVAEENEFVDNTRGLYFDNSPQSEEATCVLRRNLFALNDAGVSVLPDTRRARFEANTFLDNLTHVEVIGYCDFRKNSWEGNYWSDHIAYDTDGDGVSEIPYAPQSLYEDLLARHPELGLLRFSPSISAIEFAGRMFPLSKADVKLHDEKPSIRVTVEPRPAEARGANAWLLIGSIVLLALPLAGAHWAGRILK